MTQLTSVKKSCVALAVGQALLLNSAAAAPIQVGVAGCSFADAILSANTNASVGDCTTGMPGADVIEVSSDYSKAVSNYSYGGVNSMLPTVTSEITIQGVAQVASVIERPVANPTDFRILAVSPLGKLTLQNIAVRNGVAPEGAGVFVTGGTLNLINSTVSSNTATAKGGGISAVSNAILTLDNSSVSNNQSDGSNAGINGYEPSSINISNSQIADNTAATYGGGIGVFGNGSATTMVTMNIVSVTSNTAVSASEAYGGGAYLNGVILDATDLTVTGNSSGLNGGGLYLNAVDADIKGTSKISDNQASGSGGGLQIKAISDVTITGAAIASNLAGTDGGAVCSVDSDFTLNKSTLSTNTAVGQGGAIIKTNGSLTILTSTISGNQASERSALSIGTGSSTVINSTIYNNSVSSLAGAGAVSVYSQTIPSMFNTVIGGSNGAECGGVNIGGSDNWFQDASCNGTAQGSPRLNALADNNEGLMNTTLTHAPNQSSGLLGAANISYCGTMGFETDQRGVARAANCDIGAFEGSIAGEFDVSCFVVKAANNNVVTFCL